MALGFSASSGVTYPSIRYTGRLAGDALGTMTQGETTLYPGAGSQTHSSGRWGDYSALALDPDGCTFWYTQEYYASTSSASWRTRIGSFKFASCGGTPPPPSADLSIVKTGPGSATQGSNVSYTLTMKNNGPNDATGMTATDTAQSGLTLVSASSPLGTCTVNASSATCGPGALANGATTTMTVVATASSLGTFSNTGSVTGTPSDPNTANNSSTIFTTVSAPSTAPTVSTCVPGAAKPGAATSVVVTGTGFKSGASADFGARVTVQSVTVNGSTQLTVKIKVNPNAAIGPRTVTVTNTDGQSGSKPGCFNVTN